MPETCQVVLKNSPSLLPVPKEKKKKSEKRKEKSRDAARCRRSRESEIFQELSDQLPFGTQLLTHLDKASLVRLAIGFLKTRYLFSSCQGLTDHTDSKSLYDSFYLPTIDGFVLVMSQDGVMIYLSENVDKYLGISQVDLMGHSIFEYSHPCDHEEVREVLQRKAKTKELDRQGAFSLFVRMKCALTQKGKSLNYRSSAFKVIHCKGHVLQRLSIKASGAGNTDRCLVSLGEPVPHPSNIEVPLDQQSFISRHSLDMKFTYVDQRMSDVLGYKSEDIMGKSVYMFYHASDVMQLDKCFKTLFSKGQSETNRYRFLAKEGGFVWLLTQATLIYESGSSKPQCVVCINYVLSGQENQDEIMSLEQIVSAKMPPEPTEVTAAEPEEAAAAEEEEEEEEEKEEEEPSLPQANTTKIFAPRTADMNKGFLTFVDDDSGRTVLKEEPEDLTHLAPQAGDVCFPLDMSISYPDFMDEAFLPCSLEEDRERLADLDGLSHSSNSYGEDSDLASSSSPERNLKSLLTNDPFLCLREEEGNSPVDHVLSQLPNYKGLDKILQNESKRTKYSLANADNLSGACRGDSLHVQEDYLSECTPYIPMNDVDDFLLSPTSSLFLDSPSSLQSESIFVGLEDSLISPVGSSQSSLAKLLKRDRTMISHHNVKHPRNDLHSDGSSECPEDYDSDPFQDSGIKLTQPVKAQRLLSGPTNVITRSTCEIPAKGKPQLLPWKQPQLFENAPSEVLGPGRDKYFLVARNVHEPGTGRTIRGAFHLEAPVTSIERKQPFPSPPDPPPKRNGPRLLGPLDSSKKIKIDPRLIQKKGAQGSVLLNLLVRGEDASHGYLCPASQSDPLKYKLLPGAAILHKPLNTQAKLSLALHPEGRATRRAQNLLS